MAAAAPAASAFVNCDYQSENGIGTLNVRFQPSFGPSSAQTARVVAGFPQEYLVYDGESPRGCSGSTSPTLANTDVVNVVDEVAGGSQTLVVDTPAALSGEVWKVSLGDGSDTVSFVVAKGISVGSLSGVVVNFNSHEDTEDDLTGALGVDLFTVVAENGTGNGGSFFGDGSRNGTGATPTSIPLRFDATPSLTAFPNVLRGGANADVLIGSKRADTISGGAGDDTVVESTGNDAISGDAGADTITFAAATDAVSVDLAAGMTSSAATGTDALTGVEQAIGGSAGDTLAGDAGANRLDGGPGEDALNGRGGADTVLGGAGTDTLSYAEAASGITLDLAVATAQAGAEGDTVSGVETLLGSPFTDRLGGSEGSETFVPGAGTDSVEARGGDDVLVIRDDTVDTVTCGAGSDSVTADFPGTDAIDADCEARSLADAPPPDTSITNGPVASGRSRTATFAFTGTGNSPAFECKLDAEAFGGCVSPKAYGGLALGPHTFSVRAKGLDGDLDPTPATAAFTVLPSDNDGDGVTEDRDCDDANAKRRPGAKEVAGNGVDEDCDRGDKPFGRVASPIRIGFQRGAKTRLTRLTVLNLVARSKVTLRCRGPKRSCPFKTVSRTYKKARKSADVLGRLKGRKLKPGTVVEVEVSAPERIGKALRLTMRKAKAPSATSLCRTPGAKKLRRCK